MSIYFDHQLCLLFSNISCEIDRQTRVNNRHITIEYINIQLMYNKNDNLAKWSIFNRCLMSFFAYSTPFPLDPRRPLHMLYIYIATIYFPKGILGLGGKASKNKLKDAIFIFSMANVTILSIFRTHAQKEYCKVLEIKGTYILNIVAHLHFENLQRIYYKARLNGTQ